MNSCCGCKPNCPHSIQVSLCDFVFVDRMVSSIPAEAYNQTWDKEDKTKLLHFQYEVVQWEVILRHIWHKISFKLTFLLKDTQTSQGSLVKTIFRPFLSLICIMKKCQLFQSFNVAPLDMRLGPSCLTDVLFRTRCDAVLCIPSTDAVGTPQLVASM